MTTNDTICTDGMSIHEDKLYVNIAWWLEGVVHIIISFIGLFANSISMCVMLSKGKYDSTLSNN